ncbi:LCP family protein [Leucobacter soli]|uniref:Polyisoprenyl-teichoic acid--peptidoglycan teichoic acid transferase TagU n=1 Tax=Leucobacter soli TaxID=2812850 RepID=A0A916JXN1_9MICO|nr:LCP family protein [Leucobacter soli]CAG7613059.1 Polyisoprenyl-teichoic acid--peptidoglycan teichoic acid transferase TagU [Leucobacter soli]
MAREKSGSKSTRGGVRHGSLRRSSAWANAGKVLLTGVLAVVLSGAAVAAYAVWGLVQEVNTIDLPQNPDSVDAGDHNIDGAFSIMLVGSDSRQGQSIDDGETGELNDVNLVLHVSEDHKNATIISFPRDLMLAIPSCPGPNGEPEYYPAMSEQQLNSALMYGGLPCAVATIENLTGLDIPYAGLITFDGVIAMSNAIGGVKVCLTEPIFDEKTDLDLAAGNHKLKGKKALQFLRTRYGVGDGGDKSRISNQQVFMSAMVRQLQSAETLSNPVTVYALAKAGLENMQLSKNMADVQFMQALAGTVKDIDLERINFVQYPTSSHPYQSGRLTPNYEAGQMLIEVVESGELFTITGTGTGVVKDGDEPADDGSDADTDAEGTEGSDGESTESDGPVELPESISGQSAADKTCSAGRTVY